MDAKDWQMVDLRGRINSLEILAKRAQARSERLETAANEVLRFYMPQFNDSRAVDDCLVGLAAAVADVPTQASGEVKP